MKMKLKDKQRRSKEKGGLMQQFIIEISQYARSRAVQRGHQSFLVIPQNGLELAFNNLDEDKGLDDHFMHAVDGFGVEELFYDGKKKVDKYRLDLCRRIKTTHTVMVADYVKKASDEPDAIQRSLKEGFLCFPRSSTNYDYHEIPHLEPLHVNTANINRLSDARNYLYLIDTEKFSNKQHMLQALQRTNYDVLLIDAFFNGDVWAASEVAQLKTKANGGKRLVIAYMNIGAAEKFRYYWQKGWRLHHPPWLKKLYDGYDDEIWVKYWYSEWKDIIVYGQNSYTQIIVDAGFDGVYLDNVEAYYSLYFD